MLFSLFLQPRRYNPFILCPLFFLSSFYALLKFDIHHWIMDLRRQTKSKIHLVVRIYRHCSFSVFNTRIELCDLSSDDETCDVITYPKEEPLSFHQQSMIWYSWDQLLLIWKMQFEYFFFFLIINYLVMYEKWFKIN